MSNFQIKQLEDYIIVLKNLVPHNCDEILNEYKDYKDFVVASTTGGINLDVRKCFNIQISDQLIMTQNYEVRKKIDEELFLIVGQAGLQYNKTFCHANNFSGDSGYTLLKYELDGEYKYHIDDSSITPRKLSLSLTLNDDFEGGEFSFFYGQKNYKLNKGDGIMFPSNFMYPHAVLPITSGVRYSIVTWFI
jgi:predicted 2-oxoglutarate/Fe(II)-dependent dioxygenase YbiX